ALNIVESEIPPSCHPIQVIISSLNPWRRQESPSPLITVISRMRRTCSSRVLFVTWITTLTLALESVPKFLHIPHFLDRYLRLLSCDTLRVLLGRLRL